MSKDELDLLASKDLVNIRRRRVAKRSKFKTKKFCESNGRL